MIGSLGKIHPEGAGQALNTDRGDAHAAAPLTLSLLFNPCCPACLVLSLLSGVSL
jgi:hypothetical protein